MSCDYVISRCPREGAWKVDRARRWLASFASLDDALEATTRWATTHAAAGTETTRIWLERTRGRLEPVALPSPPATLRLVHTDAAA